MDIEPIKKRTLQAIGPLKSSSSECFFGTRTNAGRKLPDYFLVYFMLVDLLGFRHLGRDEKVAWSIPVDFEGRTYIIEHRKMGLGVFYRGGIECEKDAKEIVRLVKKGVSAARSYFDWLADESLKGSKLNVKNHSEELFERFRFLAGLFEAKQAEASENRGKVVTSQLPGGGESFSLPGYQLEREADWLAIATIESFFSWTEHVLIHLAILQGICKTGEDVDQLAGARWGDKFKTALDISDPQIKRHYDDLVAIRNQVRNVEAHGAFGKNSEAFHFHSGAGAVPVMLPHRRKNRSKDLNGQDSFELAQRFINFLQTGSFAPAWIFLDSGLDTILTEAANGDYKVAMASEDKMRSFVEYREYVEDMHRNMDF